MPLELHSYQRTAVAHLHAHPRSALWLEMSLGKTAAVLTALTPDHLPALVTAPRRVAEEVWRQEASLWRPDLKVVLVEGEPAQRAKLLQEPADIHVTSRDRLHDAIGRQGDWRTFVIDESSGFKNRASVRWKTAKKLVQGMAHVWELTGTPAPNGYMDLWSQIYLLDGGERLGKTITAYRDRYFRPGQRLPNGVITEWIIREGAAEAIERKVADICMSMQTDDYLELPPYVYNTVSLPLEPRVRKIYKTLVQDMVVGLDLIGEVVTASNAGALSNRLSQLTAGFLYSDDQDGRYEVIHHDRPNALEEIVAGSGSPILCFYRYIAEREMLQKALPGITHSIDEPDAVGRWNRGEIPVLLAHPASAGHGLNLQHGGHTVVWATTSWSLEEYQQGNGRLRRQGQKQPVIVHHLVAPKTVDVTIQDVVQGKKTAQQALMDHVASLI